MIMDDPLIASLAPMAVSQIAKLGKKAISWLWNSYLKPPDEGNKQELQEEEKEKKFKSGPSLPQVYSKPKNQFGPLAINLDYMCAVISSQNGPIRQPSQKNRRTALATSSVQYPIYSNRDGNVGVYIYSKRPMG
jgi:hypothetical protein